jgi:Tfp pilus assembly protein PilN
VSRILNLARAPFVNSRPVVRAALALWLFGGGLLVANVVLFAGYRSSTAGKQAELELTRERIAAEQKKIGDLAAQLERSRVPQLAQQVQFLNARIAERTFDWGLLFDRLADVLPWNVRIGSLSPVTVQAETRAGSRGAAPPALTPERFRLHIAGAAQDDEALLGFVDALFQHASFQGPDLQRESRQGELAFDLAVTYLPGAEPPAAAPAASTGAPAASGAKETKAGVP